MSQIETRERILDVAQALVQTRGYNAFSYADISSAIGITKASIHYHFPTKAELGAELVGRYRQVVRGGLAWVGDQPISALHKLTQFFDFQNAMVVDGKVCVCVMLSSEVESLDEPIRMAVRAYFDEVEAWLTQVLTNGQAQGTLHLRESARDQARYILTMIEGAMHVARAYNDPTRFAAACQHQLRALTQS